jgi:hypothetical protein
MSSYQKVVYEGRLSNYQRYGKTVSKKQIEYERDPFNPYQNFLYKRALFGLSVYGEEELSKMHWDKKKRIQKVHTRAQDLLNTWKQELLNDWTSTLLSKIFWHSTLVKDYKEKFVGNTDPGYISPVEFKDLGITKTHIIDKLIKEKILPSNFYQLKEAV